MRVPCPVCQKPLKAQRAIAELWSAGLSYANISKAQAVPVSTLKRHFTQCLAAQSAHAEWARRIDYAPLIDNLERGISDAIALRDEWVETGGPWGAVAVTERMLPLIERLSALYDRAQDTRVEQLSEVAAKLATRFIEQCPVTASEEVQKLMDGYPAARAALVSLEDKRRMNDYAREDREDNHSNR